MISGTGLGANSSVIFPTVDSEGVAGTVNVRVASVAPDGSTATVLVPNSVTTGDLALNGATGSAPLQIVPRIDSFNYGTTFAAGGNLRLNGGGFVEGTATINFGAVAVVDPDTGPNQIDVLSGTALNVTIPSSPGTTVSIETAGGTSNAVDMTLPTVEIRTPKAGEDVVENSTITMRVTAMDNAALQPIEFLVDGTLQFTDTTAPYEFAYAVPAFDAAATNTVTLGARATDADANTTVADIVINIIESVLAPDERAFARDSQNRPVRLQIRNLEIVTLEIADTVGNRLSFNDNGCG